MTQNQTAIVISSMSINKTTNSESDSTEKIPSPTNEVLSSVVQKTSSGDEMEKNDVQNNKKLVKTDYKLIQNFTFQTSFDSNLDHCQNGKYRGDTSPIFSQQNKLDFQTLISTPLKVLLMGDSVGIQFSQFLQDTAGASHNNRKVLRYTWGNHEGLHIASPIRGGGAIAGWRITGMFGNKGMNNIKYMPNHGGGGWMEQDVRNIRRALAAMSDKSQNSSDITSLSSESSLPPSLCNNLEVEPNDGKEGTPKIFDGQDNKTECPEEDFDVVIQQIPFGWIGKPVTSHITYESIHELVQLSGKYFGAKTVILQTIPVNNNVIDMVAELDVVNNAILNYTNTYDFDDNEMLVQKVLVMDLAKLSYELFAHNAAAMDMIALNTTEEINQSLADNSILHLLNPLLANRTKCCHPTYGQIIGFACSNKNIRYRHCYLTRYSADGMHWCMDKVGGRISGGIACLLKCVEQDNRVSDLRDCEKQCNDKFMSLRSLEYDGVVNTTTSADWTF
jgi:hypothetical protein